MIGQSKSEWELETLSPTLAAKIGGKKREEKKKKERAKEKRAFFALQSQPDDITAF